MVIKALLWLVEKRPAGPDPRSYLLLFIWAKQIQRARIAHRRPLLMAKQMPIKSGQVNEGGIGLFFGLYLGRSASSGPCDMAGLISFVAYGVARVILTQ